MDTAAYGDIAMDLLYLDETQNEAFDEDFQTPDELATKFTRIRTLMHHNDFEILDLGGGNGRFVDEVLAQFPSCRGTLFDISPALIALNKAYPRKRVVIGNVASLEQEFPPQSFDIITINLLLHHLVGSTYQQCAENCRTTLTNCRSLLKKGGVIIVTENMFDGFFGSNLPSWIIYCITSIKLPLFTAISRKFFNTAGVGVGFRSTRAWESIFADAGLRLTHYDDGPVWSMRTQRKLAYMMAGLKRPHHRHFYLQSK
jgi:SAM-dependent methyltransferase